MVERGSQFKLFVSPILGTQQADGQKNLLAGVEPNQTCGFQI